MSNYFEEMDRASMKASADAWEELLEGDPETAKFIAKNAKKLGYTKIIRKKADGREIECYIPEMKTEEEIAESIERRERFYNKPSVEEYAEGRRANDENITDEQIAQEYAETYYDLGM